MQSLEQRMAAFWGVTERVEFSSADARIAWDAGYGDYYHGVPARPNSYYLGLADRREPDWYARGYQTAWDRHIPDNPLFGSLPYQHMPDGPATVSTVEQLAVHVTLWKAAHVRPLTSEESAS